MFSQAFYRPRAHILQISYLSYVEIENFSEFLSHRLVVFGRDLRRLCSTILTQSRINCNRMPIRVFTIIKYEESKATLGNLLK